MLCNPTAALIPLDDVSVIGAMLGDIGHSMPFDSSTGAADAGLASLTSVASGSMHRETARGEDRVRNTTISAVAALGEFDQRLRLAEIDIRKTEGECQGPLTLAEKARVVSDVHRDAPGGAEIRLVVYDNISAVVPLPPSFPSGPLDERIGHFGKRLRRTYVGAALATLEGKERAGGITRDDPLGLRNVTACDG